MRSWISAPSPELTLDGLGGNDTFIIQACPCGSAKPC